MYYNQTWKQKETTCTNFQLPMDCAYICWTVSVVHNKGEYIQGIGIDTKTLEVEHWMVESWHSYMLSNVGVGSW